MPVADRVRAAVRALAGDEPLPPEAVAYAAASRRADAARANPGVLRASGMPITVNTSTEQLRALTSNRQQWQTLAWGYRKLIGELRQALRYRANAISRVVVFGAQVDPRRPDVDPIPLSLRHDDDPEKAARITVDPRLAEAVEEELARLPLASGYQFLGVWSENFDVAGECYLHGYTDPDTGQETWAVRSISEIELTHAGRIGIRDPLLGGTVRPLDLEVEEIHREWVPDPEMGHLPDSPLRSLLDTLEDIVLAGREKRAVRRSRIAANGIFRIPVGLTMARAGDAPEGEDTAITADPSNANDFMANLGAAFVAPISNEGDPGGVVPLGVIGETEDLKAFDHFRVDREGSPELQAMLLGDLSRMANGLDLPSEMVTGMGDANHWTAWQIDASSARHHIEPGVRMIVDSLTMSFLRHALRLRGFSPEEIGTVRAWYSLDALTENVNRRQDALDVYDRLGIGPAALRDATGFDDGDAPSPEELAAMIAVKQGVDPTTAAALLRWHLERDLRPGSAPDVVDAIPVAQSSAPAALPSGQPAGATAPNPPPAAPSGNSVPSTAPSTVIASGAHRPSIHSGVCQCGGYLDTQGFCSAPDSVHAAVLALTAAATTPVLNYRIAEEQAARLLEIERVLRARILTAADAAILRAAERAGARLRAKATSDRELSLRLRGHGPLEIGQMVGRDRAFALGADDAHLFADAFRELGEKVVGWIRDAITDVGSTVAAMLGFGRGSKAADATRKRVTAAMDARVEQAWTGLEEHLHERVRVTLFDLKLGETAEDEFGEPAENTAQPGAVRRALAEVGGLPAESSGMDDDGRPVDGQPVGGLTGGTAVRDELAFNGAVELGYTWVYGIVPRGTFPPHHDLDGARFASWTDKKLDTDTAYGGKYAWVGSHFRPGDHRYCQCDYRLGYAVPVFEKTIRDQLAEPSQAMRDILALAQGDDRAGRRGTDAQEQRDRYNHVQQLKNKYLEGL